MAVLNQIHLMDSGNDYNTVKSVIRGYDTAKE